MLSQVRAGLVGDRLVADARSVLLDMVVIMGRQQVRLGEKERFVLECELKENVKDFAIREDLLKQSVYSNEDITQQEDVHGDVGEGKVEVGHGRSLHHTWLWL